MSVTFRGSRGTKSHGLGLGVLQVEVLDAASQAGLQGAQPLPGGLGVSPSIIFLLLRGPKQGVPGDAVPWPGARGCPP